jgi:hypothetical protein
VWAVSLCVQSINILSQRKTLYSYGQRGLPMCHRAGTYELHGEAVQTRASRLPLKQYPLKMATRSPPWLPLQRVFIVVVICRLLLLKGSGHRFPQARRPCQEDHMRAVPLNVRSIPTAQLRQAGGCSMAPLTGRVVPGPSLCAISHSRQGRQRKELPPAACTLMAPVSTARRRLIPQPCCERCPAGAAGRGG